MTPWLDHVAVATDSLDRAAAAYRQLGFKLTRRSSHSGKDGPWGTGNHCAMLRDGYFELIGITDPALYHDHLKAALARYTGLHLLALGTSDSDRTHSAVAARGAPIKTPYDIARQVPFGDGEKEGRFRITEIEETWFPEADFFFCQHNTPDVLWQPDLLDHPNGVMALASATLASPDPAATAQRIESVTGVSPDAVGAGFLFNLARGAIEVIPPDDVSKRFPGVVPPVSPWVAAVTFRVSDLDLIRGVAHAGGIELNTLDDGGVWVGPQSADGAVVVFHP